MAKLEEYFDPKKEKSKHYSEVKTGDKVWAEMTVGEDVVEVRSQYGSCMTHKNKIIMFLPNKQLTK